MDETRTLSPAESEVAALAVSGQSNAEIATFRGTSLRTTANQIASLFSKLGVHSRLELVTIAPLLECISPSQNLPHSRPWHTLTQNETTVIIHAAQGRSHKIIAYELGLSVSAVGRRLAEAARKVGVRSRLALVAAYQREAAGKPSSAFITHRLAHARRNSVPNPSQSKSLPTLVATRNSVG
jgi:DNA-binding NarL/FixJ family response regulator